MSRQIKCDVKGCNTTDRIDDTLGRLPAGWRQLIEMRIQHHEAEPTEMPDAAKAMGAAIAERLGIPEELTRAALEVPPTPIVEYPITVSFDICALHALPEMVQPEGAPPPPPLHAA